MRRFDAAVMKSLLLSVVLTLLVQVLMITLGTLLLRSKDLRRQRTLRFGSIFANCGFMSLPLQEVMLGSDGTLYGSAYVIMFNLVVWSYGVYLISGDKRYIQPKKLFVNPGIAGLLIGLIIFVFSVPVPHVLSSTVNYLAAIYTPLPMLIIGYHLSKTNVLKAFKDVKCIIAVLLRLIVSLGVLYILGVRGTLLVSVIISLSAPVAAVTTMFSSKFGGGDTALSVDMVSLSTVLSIITMPAVITLAQLLA